MNIKKIDVRKANSSEEARKEYIAQIATMTRGLDGSKDPDALYTRLMTEAHGGSPGRPLEFIPVKFILNYTKTGYNIRYEDNSTVDVTEDFVEDIKKYSTFEKTDLFDDDFRVWHVYTNIRTLMKAGMPYERIPYNSNIEEYLAIDMKIPMFVWSQLYTHTQISKISESDRVSVQTEVDRFDFWLPKDFEEKYNDHFNIDRNDPERRVDIEGIKDIIFNDYSQRDVRFLFKDLGYPKEIWSRAIYYMQYKRSIFGAWKKDSNTWVNLLNERLNGWTQEVTKEIAYEIYKIYTGQ